VAAELRLALKQVSLDGVFGRLPLYRDHARARCAFGSSDGAKVERLLPMARPLHLPLGFAVRKEDGADTNRLWPKFPEVAYAVRLARRPGLRFTGTVGGAATTLLLAFALALRSSAQP
jgi:hypothetical protein